MNYLIKSHVVVMVLGLPRRNLVGREETQGHRVDISPTFKLKYQNCWQTGAYLHTVAFIWSPSTGHLVKNEHVFCPLWYRAGVVRWVLRPFFFYPKQLPVRAKGKLQHLFM